ncbi:MAG: 2Fe-2S iron-sulfur cluster-binding protein [Rhodobacterales bacterium]|nr:2Fe-2S iron-sulfur cluster-binding protein [Rhodobacterales bacterium]MDX5413057.1 2Fe-2S iron-sulfur cluster-binding protein [Rhodobacterales bacterium]
MLLHLTVNGAARAVEIDPRTTLLDALRHDLNLTGTKKGCDHGQCGACTVLVNGRRINACLALAVMHDGDAITTVEGLHDGDDLSPLQEAFITHDGFQCGFCTAGQLVSATAMLGELQAGWASHVSDSLTDPQIDRAEIAERMSGNMCRCACYPGILAAIAEAASGPSRDDEAPA